MKNLRKIIYAIIASILVWGCNSESANNMSVVEKDKAVSVKVEKLGTQGEDVELYYSGLSEPVVSVPMSFKLPGTVSHIYVEVGDEVSKGQKLAELDKESYQSTYNAALAMQKQAQDAYDRLKKVYDNGSLPEIKWEDAKSTLEQANSSAEIAKKNLGNCVMYAPMSGIIGSRGLESGTNVIMGNSVMTLISMGEMYARISAPEDEINKIEKGQKAVVTFPALGGKTYDGVVDKVGIMANVLSKTFEVSVIIDNDDFQIKPGMICNVNLPLDSNENGLLVPIQSVLQDEDGQNYVYIVGADNLAKRRNVTTEGIINNQLNILTGLNAGDLLIVDGQQKLRGNELVQFK